MEKSVAKVTKKNFNFFQNQVYMSTMAMKRLQKELQNLIESPPEGIKVGSETVEGSDMST